MLPIFASLPRRRSNLDEKIGSSPASSEDEGEDQQGVLVAELDDQEPNEDRVDSSEHS